MRALTRSVGAALVLSAGALFGFALAGSDHEARKPAPGIHVTEADFKIKAPRTARAGDLRLSIENKGPVVHELFVVRADHASLPLRPDGLTVDEDAIARASAGSADDVKPGTVRHLEVQLTPGRYVLMCNMSGHYLGGMHENLVVQ
jgi:uncharacterized cupredoxin-like copper-binding protein